MKQLCVFCGSAVGQRPVFADAARALAIGMVTRGIGLVYGGGSIGLMGVLADAMLAVGGNVIGVIPRPLARKEIAHAGLSELIVTRSMHERKATMADLADGFVALPGGLGTFEELLEMLTWSQLGIHRKPVAVLDIEGYWRGLRLLLDDGMAAGFLHRENADLLLWEHTTEQLLDAMLAWQPPPLRRVWLEPPER